MPEQDNLPKKAEQEKKIPRFPPFNKQENREKNAPQSPEKYQDWSRDQKEALKGHVSRHMGRINQGRTEDLEGAMKDLFPDLSGQEIKDRALLFTKKEASGGNNMSIEEEQRIVFAKDKYKAWKAIDEILSKIYSIADMKPDAPFDTAFNIEEHIKISAIQRAAQDSQYSEYLVPRLNTIHSMRRLVHNAMYLVEGGHGKVEDTMKMMQAQSGLSDAVFGTEGVAAAHRLYEDFFEKFRMDNLRSAKQENWIGSERIFYNWRNGKSDLDASVGETFKKALMAGAIDGTCWKKEQIGNKDGEWAEWKINRALHLGRAYGSVTGRFPELVSTVRLPEDKEMVSPYTEDFVRTFNLIEHLARKFGVGNQMAYLYYLFTDDKRIFKDEAEMKKAFNRATDRKLIMKKNKKQRDSIPNYIWNLTGIDTRTGGWRLKAAGENIESKFLGIEANLEDTRKKPGVWKKGNDLQEALKHNQEMWDFTLKRTPLVVLRGLLPVFPELQYEINHRVFGAGWGTRDKDTGNLVALSETEQKIENAEQWLLILKEKAVKGRAAELDFGLVPESERKMVQSYAHAIRDVIWDFKPVVGEASLMGGRRQDLGNPNRTLDRAWLLDKNGDMKKIFTHTIAVSDIPFEDLDYIKTGQIGNLGRRWRDINGADMAKNGFMEMIATLPRAHKAEDYFKMIEPFYNGIRDFDKAHALEMTAEISKMIVRANQKTPGYQWTPAGLDMVPSMLGINPKPKSYAQHIFGTDAACWDKVDSWNFIKSLGEADMINSLGEDNAEHRLIKDLKIGARWRVAELAVRWGPFILGYAGFILLQKLLKDMEEDLKEN